MFFIFLQLVQLQKRGMQSTFPRKMLIKLFKKFFALVKSLFNIV